MIDLEQYVKDATRTESRIEAVEAPGHLLAGTLEALIALGNILDMIKKNVYYGKDIDFDKLQEYTLAVQASLVKLDPALAQGEPMYFENVDPRLFHAIIGIATESTELLEAMVEVFTSEEPIDAVNICEELGDVNWYQAIAIDTLEADFENILNTNIAKLKKRFPEKFTSENAIERDLDAERQILEGGDETV